MVLSNPVPEDDGSEWEYEYDDTATEVGTVSKQRTFQHSYRSRLADIFSQHRPDNI
jgi:hypothetical protein